jgi:biopolymer transport protein ExbD
MAFNSNSDSGSDRDSMSEINVTPLVDVMLVLLVVFIVTAPLLTQAVRVDLPQTEKADTPPDKPIATISIEASGKLMLNEQAQELAALETQLQALLKTDPELTVQFQADKMVPYGKVAEAMAVVHKAGIGKLAFITLE